ADHSRNPSCPSKAWPCTALVLIIELLFRLCRHILKTKRTALETHAQQQQIVRVVNGARTHKFSHVLQCRSTLCTATTAQLQSQERHRFLPLPSRSCGRFSGTCCVLS
ncbi:unnamed protein product, partial [Ectocarpus sp. 12 AP-2014]